MTIHREGYIPLIITTAIIIVVIFAFHYFLPSAKIVHKLVYATCLVMFLLILQFFRSPSRTTPKGDDLVICPADGKVVVIEKVFDKEYFNAERIQVSIFMSPLNVHVNRAPIAGKVDYVKYHPGEYLVAWHPKSSELNERTSIAMSNGNDSVMFKQIAGAVARRIRWYVKEGDQLGQGDEFGFIKFGSRVDVLLPLDAEINVALDQKVVGGETILAKFK